MSSYAISVQGLSKRYQLGVRREDTLRDTFAAQTRRLLGRSPKAPPAKDFWALRDLSFTIPEGEVVGIIGRNGAGKSTLLKILSQITEPTDGEVRIRGRVASLLEVGTGFHPELSGRENIYLNGAILGMRRAEIRRNFDAIVAFSGVEQFLETPVKRYSSGMYVRLAFAVAAHLQSDILFLDEVLAVGDAEFQKKCLSKVRELADSGRTALFVSHNLNAVSVLCTRGLLLSEGRLVLAAPTAEVIAKYAESRPEHLGPTWQRPGPPTGTVWVESVAAQVEGSQPELELRVTMEIGAAAGQRPAFVAIDIADAFGAPIMQALPELKGFIASPGPVTVAIRLPPLIPGTYHLSLWLGPHNTETYDFVPEVASFEILHSPTPGRTYPHTSDHGCIVPAARVLR